MLENARTAALKKTFLVESPGKCITQKPITMGKIYSPLAGNIKGRVGATVFRKGQKATVAAQYQPSVGNPKTSAQAINRAAFATATAAQSGLKFLVDHSFENLRSKRECLQRFMALNQKSIAADIKSGLDEGSGDLKGIINLKGVAGIQPYPFKVSEGSLSFLPEQTIVSITDGSVTKDYLGMPAVASTDLGATITTQAGYEAALAILGLRPGDELAAVCIMQSDNISGQAETSEGILRNHFCSVQAARVTFVTTLPDAFSGTLIVNDKFNPALIERKEGDLVIKTKTTETAGQVIPCLAVESVWSESMAAGALIRSAVDANGKYCYSPATMAVSPVADGFAFAIETYMEVSNAGNGSRLFLDNPARVNPM